MAAEPDSRPMHDGPLPGFDGLYGLELLRADGDEVRGRVTIDERHLQPFGIVHGGVYAAMAESMASMGTFYGTNQEKFVAGLSNVTNFLRPVAAGQTVTRRRRPAPPRRAAPGSGRSTCATGRTGRARSCA